MIIPYTGTSGRHGSYVFEYDTYQDTVDIPNFHCAFFTTIISYKDKVEFIETKGRLKQHLKLHYTEAEIAVVKKVFFDKETKQIIEGYFAHKNGYNLNLERSHPYRIYRP